MAARVRRLAKAAAPGATRRRYALVLGLASLLLACGAQAIEPVISTFAGNGKTGLDGDGGDRREASLVSPVALTWQDAEHLLYLDMGRERGGRVRRIGVSTGVIETIAGGGTLPPDSVPAREARLAQIPLGLAIDSRGNLFIGYESIGRVDRVDARTGLIARFAGGGDSVADGSAPGQLALKQPVSVRVDDSDNVYIVDASLHAVFRIDADTGQVLRVAGTPGQSGHAGDGGSATRALLNRPTDIGWDRGRNLYIADRENHVIRRVAAAGGAISTFAGVVGSPGFAGDGGSSQSAQFRYPQSLLVEDDQLLVADRMNHRIRRIDLGTGVITTIAGSRRAAYAGENVPALAAGLNEPMSILRDRSGGLLIAAARSKRLYLLGNPVELPVPWWRSGWAIAIYLTGLGLLVSAVVQVRTRSLRANNAALEASVRRRSREIEQQNVLIERQSKELAGQIEIRDRLMARISHEFRTPLTVILGPTARLLEKAPDGPFKEGVSAIARSAGRLLRLVEQLLGLVRLSHGYVGPTAPVAAAAVVRRVVAAFDSRASERGVQLQLGSVQDVLVQAHADSLEAILVTLVANAVRFTSAGGRVQVTLSGRDGKAEIEVDDSGCGIEPDRLGALFDPLGAVGREEVGEGRLGLGLALVGQLVAAQGGSIGVESELGRGSRFRLELQLALPRPVPRESQCEVTDADPGAIVSTRYAGRPFADATVLVIEDNDDMREYLRQVIAPHFRCLVAPDGEQGLDLARDVAPDLVVCDVMLPGQDGFSVCRTLKGDVQTSHIPVVLLTALEGEAHTLRGLQEGADDYIAKPFREAELVTRIGNLLDLRALLRQRFSQDLRPAEVPDLDLSSRDRSFLERFARRVDAGHSDAEFGAGQLASALAMSERQLQRKIKALTGLTPAEYLRAHRLRQALKRLHAGERPGDVAYAVGFSSQAYFSTCFKAQFGHTPGEARDRCEKPADMTVS